MPPAATLLTATPQCPREGMEDEERSGEEEVEIETEATEQDLTPTVSYAFADTFPGEAQFVC